MAEEGHRIKCEISIPKGGRKIGYRDVMGEIKQHARSSVEIAEEGDEVVIRITAADVTSLRATMNGILRDINTVNKAMEAQAGEKTISDERL